MNKTYNDLNEGYLQIKVAKSSVKQAQEHFTVVNSNFKAGVVSTSDLLESQAMLQKATDNVVDAKTMYKIKQALYLKAISKLK
jgi:outer membrane protein TolC